MTNRDALYRAILDDPDDDTLRLIYADALEEDGDAPRAAFIRREIALAGVPEYEAAWIRWRLVDRDERDQAWPVSDLPPLPQGLTWSHDPFRRGLPAAIEAQNADVFVDCAERLLAIAPVEALEIGDAKLTEVGPFAQSPWRHRLVRLSVPQGLGAHTAQGLLGPTEYERLRELHVGAALSTWGTTGAVVRSRCFIQLTALSWRDDRAQRTFVNRRLEYELARLDAPPRLRRLDLAGNRLLAGDLVNLLRAPVLHSVEDLVLSDNHLGPEGFAFLAAASLPQLRSLHLEQTRPEAALARQDLSGLLADLRQLSLGRNFLSADAVGPLLSSPRIDNLRVLDLRENRLDDAGAELIAGNAAARNLLHLDLSSNTITDAGVAALLASPYLEQLIYLNLRDNALSAAIEEKLYDRFGNGVAISSHRI